ncbi:DNA repair protein RecN [Enterococcus lemanii]|uniref:DNA repair protein RecN n=1 Tax=Enterococcus lemanii TaxID=1159752 RepID=A0ABV9N1S6_9ENTE|nr:DNA repair protein RecN [Enterococcus lemanii]MBM7708163.1 DNA repair protein RecN (Recombination protein N) [Enterococcus lemanii]
MLLELTIKNLAIIPYLKLDFHEGMTALTGETGAGKSIIIDAVGLLAGGRGSSDYIRHGADKCVIEGLFEWPEQDSFQELVQEIGIDASERLLIIQRDMSRSGKNICRVNNRIVTLANLRKIGSYLVDIQGQNEHQELLQPEKHLALLDYYGFTPFQKARANYRQVYGEFRQLEKRVHKIQQNEQSFVQRMDMLRFQQEEIAQANVAIGEEEALLEEREKLMNFQKIVDAFNKVYELLLSDSDNLTDGVSLALSEVQGIEQFDEQYQQISENLQSAYYLLQDVARESSRQLDYLEMDEERLEEVQQRLELIRQLKRKYGESITQVLTYYEQIVQELEEVGDSENELEFLEKELERKKAELLQLAEAIHCERKKIAKKLEAEITQELAELYMEHAHFEIRFVTDYHQLNEDGADQVEFYLSTNLGEALKPLVKVASGGEVSRILLALKTIFSKAQGLTSIVFDEVDTGVSGRVAQAIAEKIAQIARDSQVLCITHLPQVAAQADYQYFIAKEVVEERTQTTVNQLNEKERIKEVARMLAGTEITDLTLKHAQELLDLAHKNQSTTS